MDSSKTSVCNSKNKGFFVGDEAKGRISKRVLQENKAPQISPTPPPPSPPVCVSGWQEMFVFRKIWRALFSCNTRFEIRPFTLLPMGYDFCSKDQKLCQSFLEKVTKCASSKS